MPKEKQRAKESFLKTIIKRLKKENRLAIYIVVLFSLIVTDLIFLFLKFPVPAIATTVFVLLFLVLLVICLVKILNQSSETANEIQHMIKQKDNYLSDFSHRIRTPLNNFSFIIEYLIDQKPEGNQKEMLETLIASTTNMIEAVNDLTVRSAQDISNEPRKSIAFNLNSAIKSTIDLFSANKGFNISFNVQSNENTSGDYIGDPITIKQIFLDIFTLLQGDKILDINTEVYISSEKAGKDSETIKVIVKANTLVQDFDTEKYPYSLNKSMAAKLITRLKGKYKTLITDGVSEFRFSIPLKVREEKETQSKAAERIRELKTENPSSKTLADANILLVEDNPTNQKIVLITLRSLVKNIDTAVNGKEALDKFGKSTYDIILMDIQLPVMDGITAATKIRELEKSTSSHTPIIAITANAMIGDKEKCLSSGIDEYLSKPFQPAQLIKIIEEFVTS